jgi:diguanylate cyclase (GGDEF)-like protein
MEMEDERPDEAPGGAAAASRTEAWRRRWKKLLASPDPDLVDAGFRGELLIAGIRVLIILLLLALPLDRYLQAPGHGRQLVLWVAAAALAEALVVYSAVTRSWGRNWIGFTSGVLDVSLVSLCLGIFVRLGEPLGATNDLVLFPLYLLAIGATSLRYDWRICILTGATAVVQYATLLAYVVWLWDLDDPASLFGGEFSRTAQLGRLLLLAIATVLATVLVLRAREQRRLSSRDRLTGLANRGYFDESIPRLEALALRSNEPVSVAMIDVDRFKRFNDTHGHPAGDRALKAVADAIASSFRTTDLVARYGGEEFAGLFPGLQHDDAVKRLEELRATIERLRVPVGGGATARLTVSTGLAVWPANGDNLTETLAIADGRLYLAKQSGRNRVVSSDGVGGIDAETGGSPA